MPPKDRDVTEGEICFREKVTEKQGENEACCFSLDIVATRYKERNMLHRSTREFQV